MPTAETATYKKIKVKITLHENLIDLYNLQLNTYDLQLKLYELELNKKRKRSSTKTEPAVTQPELTVLTTLQSAFKDFKAAELFNLLKLHQQIALSDKTVYTNRTHNRYFILDNAQDTNHCSYKIKATFSKDSSNTNARDTLLNYEIQREFRIDSSDQQTQTQYENFIQNLANVKSVASYSEDIGEPFTKKEFQISKTPTNLGAKILASIEQIFQFIRTKLTPSWLKTNKTAEAPEHLIRSETPKASLTLTSSHTARILAQTQYSSSQLNSSADSDSFLTGTSKNPVIGKVDFPKAPSSHHFGNNPAPIYQQPTSDPAYSGLERQELKDVVSNLSSSSP